MTDTNISIALPMPGRAPNTLSEHQSDHLGVRVVLDGSIQNDTGRTKSPASRSQDTNTQFPEVESPAATQFSSSVISDISMKDEKQQW
jgi:hypothetical protein